ncbi:MAG: TonB-dependent receptor [Bacteroidia bacterium]
MPFFLKAQNGILKGKVVDKTSGEELIGAAVFLQNEVTTGTITDPFGSFQISLPVGTYNIQSSYVGYQRITIENVEIKDGEITEVFIELGSEAIGLNEVVIDAKKVTNTEMSVIAERKKSYTVKDGISSQEISNSGASNASQAVKQITGASVEGGKYMVVRGLGDRYSITQLNGVTLPSTDPYRNSASLDLIPSFMLDNIMTSKTFSPDQPGNFTGGNMNIKTKSYPEKFFLNFGISTSYNTLSSFNNNFITAPEGNEMPEYLKDADVRRDMSVFGYIDAKRDARNGDLSRLEQLNRSANDLNSPMLPIYTNSLMDHGVNFSIGDMKKVRGENPLGYVFGIKYKKGYNYYDNGFFGRWEAMKDGMIYKFDMTDENGTINENVGAYASLSYQFASNHEITLSGLYNNDHDVFGREQIGFTEQLGNANLYRARAVGEKERTMANAQLRGTHALPNLRDAKIEWMAGYTQSSQYEPDLRFFSDHVAFANDQVEGNEDVRMDISSYGLPNHFFRDLIDNKLDLKVDYKQPFGQRKGSHLKFGGLVSRKSRNFSEYRYKVAKPPQPEIGTDRDWDPYFNEWGISLESPYGYSNYFLDDTRLQNLYTGHENIWAAYGMFVHDFTSNIKVVGGLRVEGTDIQVTSADSLLGSGKIDAIDFLPSLNIIYALNDNSNIRLSASQTLARPNMREMAPFFSFDFLGGFLYSGNDSLNRTLIQNFDLRWELFNKPGEMIAISVYYKNFINPIVRVFSPVSSTGEITFENLDNAVVYGAEFEWRKNLDFISESLDNFKIAANVSYTYSQVAIPLKDQESIQRNGLLMGDTRPFQGQSPFLANANIYYNNDSLALQSSLTFNVFGKRLYEIGATGNPDIYEMPRPLLNYNITKTVKENLSITVSVGNILGSKFLTQQFYESENLSQVYKVQEYDLGRTYSLSLAYKIR